MTDKSTGTNKNHLGLSKETVDQIRRQIVYDETVEPPKNSSRFQKGTSVNPKGRPRKNSAQTNSDAAQLFDKMQLRIARQKISVREGDKITEMSTKEVVTKAQVKSAMTGNAMAQRDFCGRREKLRSGKPLKSSAAINSGTNI